ncbi:MAG: VIT domain-containing protein [Gemmatimonadaceae bacterium]
MRRGFTFGAIVALVIGSACNGARSPDTVAAVPSTNVKVVSADSGQVGAARTPVLTAQVTEPAGKPVTPPVPTFAYRRQEVATGVGGATIGAMHLDEATIVRANELVVLEKLEGKSRGDVSQSYANVPIRARAKAMKEARDGEIDALNAAAAAIPVTQGTLRARNRKGDLVGEFPLKHTEVSADISGYLARTTVEQRYENSFSEPIEAVYTFPLPAMSAVNDFVMQIGTRKIVGIVRPKAEAEQIYREAVARGQTASLMTQERPNIFNQQVANIEPGGTVTIAITYFERLDYAHGEYEWTFPMVVGPRYMPGGSSPVIFTGSGGAAAHPANPSPPVLKPGQRSGHDIGLTVTLDAGLPITKFAVPTHRIDAQEMSASRRSIHLASNDSIPNRDFVLRWSVAGAETQFGVLAHRAKDGGYFTLTMQPPLAPRDEQVTPREVTFLLDISGSMSGFPLDIAKNVVRQTLDRLRPDDMFNLVYFESGNGQLFERAQANTPANVSAAKKWLDNIQGGGGTEMLAGLRRALQAHHDPRYLQMFVFCTDGYIGNDAEVLKAVKEERGSARFFGFGIGSSVNRYLMDGIGEQGGGATHIVLPRDSASVTTGVERLFTAIDSPVLVDIAMDWNGLPVENVYPSKLGDLFAGQTINVIGRFTRAAKGTAYVTGRIGARRVRVAVRVDLPESEPLHAALGPVWARSRIADLSTAMLTADSSSSRRLAQDITALAVEHHLVSQYTSFVAVDESRVVGNGMPVRIVQPVELPEGVSYKGIFGEEPEGRPVRIGAWGVTLQNTASGAVRVGDVDARGDAGRAGVKRGASLTSIDGTPIMSVSQLESVLLATRGNVRLGWKVGVEVQLRAP